MMVGKRRDSDFEAYYVAESRRIHELSWLLVHDTEKAAVFAQEALLRVYTAWPRIREDPLAYTRRILVNLSRSAVRRETPRRSSALHLQDAISTTSEDDRSIETLQVAQALRSLPPLRRAVLVLKYHEDMTEAQIADVLDRPIGTVKSDVSQGLRQLEARLPGCPKD